jgi:DNA-binding MarR family transcriptional regulator
MHIRMDDRRIGLVQALERATHGVGLWGELVLGDLHLTQAEIHVLGYLRDAHQCSINDLHGSLGHKRSTLTSVLDRLEHRELVRRAAHPRSRRLTMVLLTAEGRSMAERIGAALESLEQAVVDRVGLADVDACLRVIAAIEEGVL